MLRLAGNDVEGVAQSAATVSLLQFSVDDLAGEGFQDSLTRLRQAYRRVLGELLAAIERLFDGGALVSDRSATYGSPVSRA